MSREIKLLCLHGAFRRHNCSGINNVGLMSRALVLKGGANPDEQEYMKWQTLQVSTMSIASCVGRIAIGIQFPVQLL